MHGIFISQKFSSIGIGLVISEFVQVLEFIEMFYKMGKNFKFGAKKIENESNECLCEFRY